MSNVGKNRGRRVAVTRHFVDDELTHSESLIDLFENFMKAKEIEGLRERTLNDHITHFRYFKNFLEEFHPNINLGSEVSVQTIRDYIHYMKNEKVMFENHQWLADKYSEKKGLSPVTINVRLRSIKCFFKFLFDEKHIKENPCLRIKLLQTEKDTIESFTKEQLEDLLQQPDQKTYTGYRDYVIMLLLLDTGIRSSEALGLITKNFNYEQKTLYVSASIAKNKQARLLPLSKKTAKSISVLIKENSIIEPNTDHIFLTYFGDEFKPSVLRERLREYRKSANIKGVRVSPHTFRHTFAKFYILNGGDPFTLQRILGHSSMEMVRKYIQMSNEDVKVQHSQYSPISSLK
jgi:integrase/recombinase XerD